MLERFLEISEAIKKALDDRSINKRALFPEQDELSKMEELLDALDIVREGTERLQANDINLAVADEVRHNVTFYHGAKDWCIILL